MNLRGFFTKICNLTPTPPPHPPALPTIRHKRVLVFATFTSNRSILLTRTFWSFSSSVFYRSYAEHIKTSSEYVCLNLHVFISKNLMSLSSPFTLAGWLPGAMPCQQHIQGKNFQDYPEW